jgi:hypothetical protein
MTNSAQKLKGAIARLARKSPAPSQTPLSTAPGCAFGAVEEQRLRGLEQQLDEIKGRVNGLLYTLVGAVILEIVMRLV